MDEHEKGVTLGLRAAAAYVEGEADDLLQRAKDVRNTKLVALTALDLDTILRRIAADVRGLTVKRGR